MDVKCRNETAGNGLRRESYILRKKKDIDFLFEKKTLLCSSPNITVFFTIRNQENGSSFPIARRGLKVLLVVPKRLFPKAVMRNKVKRHMFEAFRIHRKVIEDMLNGAVARESMTEFHLAIFYKSRFASTFQDVCKEMRFITSKLESVI